MNQEQPFLPIEKDLLYLKISDAIFAYIKQNELKPGDKLPSERDMAQMFQTGRNSVREALRVLENRGLIEVKTGRGTFVKDSEENDTRAEMRLALAQYSFAELNELKLIIEIQSIRDAVKNASEEEKQELVAIGKELNEQAQKGQYSHTLDHKFHRKILEMSHNRIFRAVVMEIRENGFVRVWKKQKNEVWLPKIPQHYQLALAIANNDEERAVALCREIDAHAYALNQAAL